MRGFEWDALRVGDAVSVHGASDGFPMKSGTVSSVFGRFGKRTVGVTVAGVGAGTADVRWPVRLEVHLEPRDTSAPCWRCDWKQASE